MALRRDWSALPDTALLLISRHLPCFVDYFAFAGACRSWRAVAEPARCEFMSRHRPLLFDAETLAFYSPGEDSRDFSTSRLVVPRQGTEVRLVDVCQGYFIIDAGPSESGEGRRLRFVNPFTGKEFRDVPTVPTDHIWRAFLGADPSSPASRVVAYCNVWSQRTILHCRRGDDRWSKATDTIEHYYNLFCRAPDVGAGPLLFATSAGSFWVVEHNITVVETSGTARGRLAVFHLDSEKKWEKVRSLGRRAMLLSSERCVVSQWPARWGGEENSVYVFHDSCRPKVYRFPFPEEGEWTAKSSAAVPYTTRGWRLPFWIIPNFEG